MRDQLVGRLALHGERVHNAFESEGSAPSHALLRQHRRARTGSRLIKPLVSGRSEGGRIGLAVEAHVDVLLEECLWHGLVAHRTQRRALAVHGCHCRTAWYGRVRSSASTSRCQAPRAASATP